MSGSFATGEGYRAAVTARRRLVESIARGEVKPARETFGEFWTRYLEERQPYLTAGTLIDYETHGRKRLLPAFGSRPLVRIDEGVVRRWMRAITAEADAAGISRKTVNNARTCLTVALNEAVRQGLVPRNPCLGVPALPAERQELEYLRMHENGAELHS